PWNANTYWAQISVNFGEASDLEPFSQIVSFTVEKYTLEASNIQWGTETGTTYDRGEHMRTASAIASTLPKSGDATLDGVVPTLTVKAWDGSWKDKVTNVLYSGNDVTAYTVYIYHDVNLGNYQVGEKTLSATYQIDPKSITSIVVNDQSRIYGNANPTSFTFTCSDIISGDTDVLQFAILDGNTAVTSSTPVGDTYEIVPSLKTANGNYVFADDISITNGKFEITKRPITVTIKANQSAVYGANFDLNAANGIYTVSVNTLVDTATDVFTLSIDGNTNTSGLDQGTYTVSLASENGNYNITFVNSNKFTVNLAKITTINVVAYGGKYDGTAHGVLTTNTATFVGTPSVQWWVSADATKPAATSSSWTALSTVQVTNAGTYKYWVKVTADNHETAICDQQVTVTITKAELTVKAHFSIYYSENKPETENYLIGTADVLVANAAADASKAYEIGGLQGSDTVNSIAGLLGSFTYTTNYAQGNNADDYDITLALSLTSTNYTFKAETGTLTVKPLPIKVKTHTSTDFGYTEDTSYANWVTWFNTEGSGYTVELPTPTYAGSTITSPVAYSTLFTISCDAILSGNRTNDVGTYDMVMTANSAYAANYAITQTETGSITITKATNSITSAFSVNNWTYGAASATVTNPKIAFKYAEGGSSAEQLTAKLYFIKSGTTWGSTPDKTFTLDATTAAYNGGWTYNAAVIFATMSDFKAGSYKLVLTTTENKNYASASAEYTFKVNKAQLTFSTDDVTVNYGEGFDATYTFTGSGYVYGENVGTIGLSYSSGTNYSTTDRFVNGTYYIYAKNVQIDGRTPSINTNADTTFEIDNYTVTFKVASLTVTPRALTITIDNKTNIYHYLAITISGGKNVYTKQDPELISYTATGAFYGDDEGQFTLKTDAYTFENGKYQTNDAGKYPIYAVFANEDLLSSYSITIVTESGMNYVSESGEYVVESESGNNAAVFEI
ncbi:MAG: hypothetical protein K2L87_07085, partial [Clostridiales bacterium]|nr:hypothetical protein [Clostridiales bacterium]